MGQLGFFDLSRRYEGLDVKGDPLVAIAAMVPWESLRPKLKASLITGGLRASDVARKSPAGRKPWELSFTKLRWKEGQSSTEPWVGMNCSACHSNELTYNGKRLRIEGAPSLTDYQSFTTALDKALDQTWLDDEKFARFAKQVLGDDNQDSDKLRGELAKLVDAQGCHTLSAGGWHGTAWLLRFEPTL
jgi:hypothetical protein